MSFSNLYAQQSDDLNYCNCTDKLDQISPVSNGRFERSCKGKLIETGSFKNGNKDGEWVTYNPKGIVIRRINYDNGKLNGKSDVFFNDGKPKLNASFIEDKPTDKWVYFTSNGKVLIEGEYADGKPVNIWTINDAKGKQPVIQYDFTAAKYLLHGELQLHKDGNVLKNDNTGEYYFIRYPKRVETEDTAPLGGALLANDLFIDLVEVPQNYWDTYIDYEYTATYNVTPENVSSFMLKRGGADKYQVQLVLIANTDPDSKIKRINHSDLSRKMMDDKINEALHFLPPWIYKNGSSVNMNVSYVINRLLDFSKPIDKNYN